MNDLYNCCPLIASHAGTEHISSLAVGFHAGGLLHIHFSSARTSADETDSQFFSFYTHLLKCQRANCIHDAVCFLIIAHEFRAEDRKTNRSSPHLLSVMCCSLPPLSERLNGQ